MRSIMKSIFRKKEKLLVLGGLALAVLLCRIFEIPCFYRVLFDIPCPTCGMTRAYISLLRFDISGAFAYHPLFWSIPILALFFWFDGKIFPKKAVNITVLAAVVSLFFIRWFFFVLI